MAVKTHTTTEERPGDLRKHEQNLVSETLASKQLFGPLHESLRNKSPSSDSICDACLFCEDTCGNPKCTACAKKPGSSSCDTRSQPFPFVQCDNSDRYYTRCQLRRHCTEDSAWLLCGNTIYDATPFLEIHPGGKQSILRKSGGVCDCSNDMAMHSKTAIKRWRSKKVGKLRKCDREAVMDVTEDQCVIS